MKKRLVALASAAALGALAGAGGCVDNRASIQPQAICVPPATCSFQATCDGQYIGYPAFDRSVARAPELTNVMSVYIQVANQLPNNADTAVGRTNTNDAHVDEIAVDYEGAVGGSSTSGSQTHIPAAGSAVVKVPLLLGGAATGEALARVRLRGYLDDGTRFETGDFPIAINVCTGCAPAACGGGATCPPGSEGQRPLTCVQ